MVRLFVQVAVGLLFALSRSTRIQDWSRVQLNSDFLFLDRNFRFVEEF